MTHILARLIIALGLGLIALGKRMDHKPAPPPVKTIKLSRRQYRVINSHPSRWQAARLGLGIIFSSARYGVLGV